MPASHRMVVPLVVPDMAGLGYIARWRSAKQLSGCVFTSKVSVPDDVREMVELATHTDHLEARARVYGERWIALWHRLYGKAIAETQQAMAGLVDRTRDYSAALINERVPTRLGDGSVDVEVDGQLISPFTGERIKVLSIRGNWLRNAEPGSMAHVVAIEAAGQTTLDVDGVRFHYDVEGLHRVRA